MKVVHTEHCITVAPELARGVEVYGLTEYGCLAEAYIEELTNIKKLVYFVALLNKEKLGTFDAKLEDIERVQGCTDRYNVRFEWSVDDSVSDDNFIGGISEYLIMYPKMLSPRIVKVEDK